MNEETIAAFDLLSRMRFACGDDGKRMQDELEEYLRGLHMDAKRLNYLDTLTKRTHKVGKNAWPISSDLHFGPMGVHLYVRTGIGSEIESHGAGATIRESIDAVMNGANPEPSAAHRAWRP